jgi:centrosomal CEP192-like protein/parallel beta helix pectate lyase-like protein/ASPM-SPD-2-Hydin domain-containing protein
VDDQVQAVSSKGNKVRSPEGLLITLISLTFGSCWLPMTAHCATLQVGPGKPFATPCAAIAAASSGDTIQIDSTGNYSGDVCQWSTNNLALIGVGVGRARIDAAGKNSQGKGIWVISGSNTTVENIEFTGASVVDLNGAGIRAEGANLTVRNCYFHDNQEGILSDGGPSTITIEFSEFFHNGAGDGFSHNLYIGNVSHLIFRYNYSHAAVIGHLLKSRAAQNDIYYNRLSDETSGTASYEIDLPNGGKSFIVGNLIEKGPNAQNSGLVSYQAEGPAPGNPDHELFVVGNTMVNDFGKGTFVVVDASVSVPAVIKDNIFQGAGSATNQSTSVQANNFSGDAKLLNPAAYDYHLMAGSPAIDAGLDPGQTAGLSLMPTFQYVHPSCAEGRSIVGLGLDIGALELNGGTGNPPPNAPPRCGSASLPAPQVGLTPNVLVFSSQTVNTSSPSQTITLANTGTAGLTLSGITLSGTNASDFNQTNTCGSTVSAGAACTINVTFVPTAAGIRTATVSIADNATGSPHVVGLSGTGLLAAPAATVNPVNLVFQSQTLGTTSATQQVTLTNSGNATLNISAVTPTGDFVQTNNCGTSLNAGGSCTISVSFTPIAGGPRTGTLTLIDDAATSPQKVALTGTGLAPAPGVSISPATLAFSGTLVGSASGTQIVTLTNTGKATLNISAISTSSDFSQTNNCSASLAPSAKCSINVSFKPASGGNRTGTLQIMDDVNGSPQAVNLSGVGMDFSLTPPSSSSTVHAGQSITVNVAVSPDGGFNLPISFACAGAPNGASCSVTPSSFTPNGISVGTVAIVIKTMRRSSALLIFQTMPFSFTIRLALGVLSIALFVLLLRSNRKRLILSFCAVVLLAVSASSCAGIANTNAPGSGGVGTPTGTYTFTISGTYGSLSHNSSFALTVN